MARVIERINKHKSIIKQNGKVLYTERGSDVNYFNGEKYEAVDCDFSPADPGDKADFKTRKSNWKTGYLKTAKGDNTKWPAAIKYSDVQVKLALRKLAWFDRTNLEYSLIGEVSFLNLDIDGTMIDAMTDLDIQYSRIPSSFGQTLKLKSKDNLPANPFGDKAELSYWTQFNFDEEDLSIYADGELWDGTENISAVRISFVKTSTNEVIFTFGEEKVIENEGEEEQKVYTEWKRLVNNGGSYYIVESVWTELIDTHDYSTPLELKYTTKTTNTISSNESWGGTNFFTGTQTVNGDSTVTHEADFVGKGEAGGGFIVFILGDGAGFGLVDSNGTDGNENYYISEHDDSTGETISSSTGLPTLHDVKSWFDTGHASSRITGDYCIVHHTGTALTDNVVNLTTANSGATFNNSVFSFNGSSICNGSATGTTFFDGDELIIINNTAGSNPLINVATGQLTHLQMLQNADYEGGTANQNIFFLNGDNGFVKNAIIECSDIYEGLRVHNASTFTVENLTCLGGEQASSNSLGFLSFGSVSTINYSIVLTNRNGLFRSSGTLNSDYNCVTYNTVNYNSVTPGVNDVSVDPGFDNTSPYRYILSPNSELFNVVTPTINDAGATHLIGRIGDSNAIPLEGTDRIPLGYCHKAPTVVPKPAVNITTSVEKADVRTVDFIIGDTVQAKGTVKSQENVTAADVVIGVYDFDHNLLATLFNGTTNLVANVSKTYTAIAGAALTWIGTSGNRYIGTVVSGGTPTIELISTTDGEFAVNAATVLSNEIPYNAQMEPALQTYAVIEKEPE